MEPTVGAAATLIGGDHQTIENTSDASALVREAKHSHKKLAPFEPKLSLLRVKIIADYHNMRENKYHY